MELEVDVWCMLMKYLTMDMEKLLWFRQEVIYRNGGRSTCAFWFAGEANNNMKVDKFWRRRMFLSDFSDKENENWQCFMGMYWDRDLVEF